MPWFLSGSPHFCPEKGSICGHMSNVPKKEGGFWYSIPYYFR